MVVSKSVVTVVQERYGLAYLVVWPCSPTWCWGSLQSVLFFQYIGHVRGINSLKKATGVVEGVRHHAFEWAMLKWWTHPASLAYADFFGNWSAYVIRAYFAKNRFANREHWQNRWQTSCAGCQELGGRELSSVLHAPWVQRFGSSFRVGVQRLFRRQDWKLGERYSMNIIADINSGCQSLSIVELKSSALLAPPCHWIHW